jgi:hypothetical protein
MWHSLLARRLECLDDARPGERRDDRPFSTILVVTFELTRPGRNWPMSCTGPFLEAHDRPLVGRLGIAIRHGLLAGDVFAIDLWNAHGFAPGFEVVFASGVVEPSTAHRQVSVELVPKGPSSLRTSPTNTWANWPKGIANGSRRMIARWRPRNIPVSQRGCPAGDVPCDYAPC